MDKLTFEQYCNEPAFPLPIAGMSESHAHYYELSPKTGITRLEYFTTIAMQGLCAVYDKHIEPMSTVAQGAVVLAERTLYELYKKEPEIG